MIVKLVVYIGERCSAGDLDYIADRILKLIGASEDSTREMLAMRVF
jgi:hypothetical protein